MSAVAAAIGVGVAGIAGAVIQGSAAQNAANTEAQAANSADQTQMNIFNTENANAQPYIQAGDSALNQLQNDMPNLTRQFTSADFYNNEDPAYQFDLNQGLQAMQRSAAAKGMLNSMGTMQNLNNYAQNMASNEYQNAYNRFTQNQQQTYGMLSGIANIGVQGTGLANSAAANAGNNISANTIGAGNAAAAGQVGTANAISSGLSTAANGYMNSSMLGALMKNNTGYGGPAAFNPDSYGGLGGGSSLTMPQVGASAIPNGSGSLYSDIAG